MPTTRPSRLEAALSALALMLPAAFIAWVVMGGMGSSASPAVLLLQLSAWLFVPAWVAALGAWGCWVMGAASSNVEVAL